MNRQGLQGSQCPQEIRVLTFAVRGIKMGVDTEQVASVMELAEAESSGLAVLHFHDQVSFGKMPADYQSPKAIMINDKSKPYIVVIDNPDDIAVVNVRSIQPIPPLIAMNKTTNMFWGAIPNKVGITLLVDFSRIRGRQEELLRQATIPIHNEEVRQ